MPANNLPKGKLGETLAADFLKRKGYQILLRNFHCRWGEIDLIAKFQNILIFVEVKTRWGTPFGTPEEAVTPWKIRSLVRTAEYFKMLHPTTPAQMQIDVVAIELNQQGKLLRINHLTNVTG
ncbi:MAG: hypothetical protein UV61_C0014G0016 [Candidatus Gottesmanbacteria bacterium GW2011_GWB1_43_11]|uniref:UPF0102 protein UV61_C0014G0016 n=1 Tax=Candidatus Gottesmanbacteria bacterium GW2011_GWB1_43_11 TaxID=1618446 RepID=A0A0G1ES65_9BACT|nr:MAG: hypothetical protein UV04_C0041G0008 [Candidatus Gottesmanbacteria bacterium GW2011_GWA2_42_16]KKS53130.1 MAG: hypothetical protein UV17_C0040G0010 [Candidatus Gottesmanbacteria bacterium GW2011_GWA1_42_26]KKS81689.1 MAG: hypothetical protein UV55_C0010G0018 [Candidatus Gottesmanbacteria bacterium GW2011_GWC1_43_10]KKS85916.1 MAG: hypothetical protein UV61_C0014G0016 [Candidatus Gottesmanbacteria bacterium GW2011_GWB1_43_11]OGG25422.1 MAG: hypothetical protein A3A59_06560 [Candidatus Go